MSTQAPYDLSASCVLWKVAEGYIVGDISAKLGLSAGPPPESWRRAQPAHSRLEDLDKLGRWRFPGWAQGLRQVGPYLVWACWHPDPWYRGTWHTKGEPVRIAYYTGERADDWRKL